MPIVVGYTVNPESLNYENNIENIALISAIHRFAHLIESLHKDEKIFFDIDAIWEAEVENGKYFYNISGNSDNERLIVKTFSKSSNPPENIPYVFNVDFYKTNNDNIYDRATKKETLKTVIQLLRDVEKYIEFMPIAFENLLFSETVPRTMERHYRPFHDFHVYITHHLETLNEYALEIYNEHSSSEEHTMCDILGSKGGFGCSLERGRPDPVGHTFSFDSVKVACYPHTKLIHDGTDYRIYFKWNDLQIQDGAKTLVGHIGGHI